MLIGLVSCSKAKLPNPAPARDLYSPSALFTGAMKLLQERTDTIYVLSAKYGLLPLHQVVEPYDQSLNDASPGQRRAWAAEVFGELQRRHGTLMTGITFEIHAGEAYREHLELLLKRAGATCTCPVEGLSMGRRLAFYAGTSPVAMSVDSAARPPLAEEFELRTLVERLEGQQLETGTGASFVVTKVGDSRVVVMPGSTRKPRPIQWRELEDAWEYLGERRSMTLAEVREVASEANPAYVFAVLAKVPGVVLERNRPMRLRLGSQI